MLEQMPVNMLDVQDQTQFLPTLLPGQTRVEPWQICCQLGNKSPAARKQLGNETETESSTYPLLYSAQIVKHGA